MSDENARLREMAESKWDEAMDAWRSGDDGMAEDLREEARELDRAAEEGDE